MLSLNINNIAQRFLRAIAVRAQQAGLTLRDLYQTIFPHPQYGPPHLVHQGCNYIPYPRLSALEIHESFTQFWDLNVVNRYAQQISQAIGRQIVITTDLDAIVGEAIHTRLAQRRGSYRVYAHQAESIIFALYALDTIRRDLRRGLLPMQINLPLRVIADLAETAGGKTEVFESIALQLVLDCKRVSHFDIPKVIILYPMKAFMVEHFRRFLRDIMYINEAIRQGRVPGVSRDVRVTIGVYCGDTPRNQDGLNRIAEWISYLLGEPRCPLCNQPIDIMVFAQSILQGRLYTCPQGHVIGVFRVTRDQIREWPPDILLMTPDMLNNILMNRYVVNDLFLRPQARGYPILIVLDEPHEYTGILGSNLSMLLREFTEVIRVRYPNYEPLYLITSATIPRAEAFLVRLFLCDTNQLAIVRSASIRIRSTCQGGQVGQLGIIALLPSPTYGVENAAVELPVVLAACLNRDQRKILVFVDSVEWAENLEKQIRSYVERNLSDPYSFWYQYNVQQLVQQGIFEPDVYSGQPNPRFINVAVLHARLRDEDRRRIENEFRTSPPVINILITTPAMELGIDVSDVDAVILIGLPPTPAKFVQRIGRTGRRTGQGLVIVIGNDKSGYDTYYLIDYNNFNDYLRLTVDYELPINPLNLEVIRGRLGNYGRYLVTAYGCLGIRPSLSDIVNGYRNLAILQPLQVILKIRLQNLAPGVVDNLTRLRDLAIWINNNLGRINRELNIIAQVAHREDWYNHVVIRQQLRQRLHKYVPFFIDDIRRVSSPLTVKYFLDYYLSRGQEIHKEIIDLKIGLTLNSISYILNFNGAIRPHGTRYITQPQYTINFYLSSRIYNNRAVLRGIIRYRTLIVNGQRLKIPFEACGLRGLTPHNIMDYARVLDNFYNTCLDLLVGNAIFDFENVLIRQARQNLRSITIQPRRIETLNRIFQVWLRDARVGIVRVVTPLEFYYEVVKPTYWCDNNRNLVYVRDSRSLHQLRSRLGIRARRRRDLARLLLHYRPLDFYEIFYRNMPGDQPTRAYKLIDVGAVRFENYIMSTWRLLLRDVSNQVIDYCSIRSQQMQQQSGVNVAVTDQVSFVCPTLSVVEHGQPSRVKIGHNNVFEVKYYDSVMVYMLNYGYFIKPARSRGMFKYIGPSGYRACYFLGHSYETKALCIEINWQNVNINTSQLLNIYSQVLDPNNVRTTSLQRLLNDFKIRVTHSLSHLILNFHSLYSGGNPWDVSEYFEFERDESGNITKSRIFIYDFDEGGNGVAEVIGGFLSKIICRGLEVIVRRGTIGIPLFDILGAPGDLMLGRWPVCPYGNALLSKAMLRSFFEDLLGQPLNTLVNQPQLFEQLIVQYIPNL